jgi:hypothetical protein
MVTVTEYWLQGIGVQKAPRNAYFAGLDLGQAQDFTALAVVLGTPYPEMVARVRHVMGRRPSRDRSIWRWIGRE